MTTVTIEFDNMTKVFECTETYKTLLLNACEAKRIDPKNEMMGLIISVGVQTGKILIKN